MPVEDLILMVQPIALPLHLNLVITARLAHHMLLLLPDMPRSTSSVSSHIGPLLFHVLVKGVTDLVVGDFVAFDVLRG